MFGQFTPTAYNTWRIDGPLEQLKTIPNLRDHLNQFSIWDHWDKEYQKDGAKWVSWEFSPVHITAVLAMIVALTEKNK